MVRLSKEVAIYVSCLSNFFIHAYQKCGVFLSLIFLVEVHFMDDRKKLIRFASHPNFVAARELNPNLVMIYLKAKQAFFNRPYAIGIISNKFWLYQY